jgi:hypothetical protein
MDGSVDPRRPPVLADELLTIDEVAARLRMPVASMRKRRSEGLPPQGFRVGKRVLYRRSVVEAFIREQEDKEWQ